MVGSCPKLPEAGAPLLPTLLPAPWVPEGGAGGAIAVPLVPPGALVPGKGVTDLSPPEGLGSTPFPGGWLSGTLG